MNSSESEDGALSFFSFSLPTNARRLMGILTMALKDEGSSGDRQSSQIQNLSRQGSLYNMTLNEVQNHLGEPLHSMNLDELLKSVFAAETNQLNGVDHENPIDQHASSSGIHRQGSITMSQGLCKKTVDEVWRDIQVGPTKGDEVKKSGHERQTTLGEMTLEDFLLKAGVVTENIMKEGNDFIGNLDRVENPDLTSRTHGFTHGASWLPQFNQIPAMNNQMQGQQSLLGAYMSARPPPQPIVAGSAPMFDTVFPEGQMNISSPTIGGYSDSQTPGRKRRASEDIVDKLSERRQKRMIKNRESAARSRARKQAYTNELENKVSRLEEENERLKKQKIYFFMLTTKHLQSSEMLQLYNMPKAAAATHLRRRYNLYRCRFSTAQPPLAPSLLPHAMRVTNLPTAAVFCGRETSLKKTMWNRSSSSSPPHGCCRDFTVVVEHPCCFCWLSDTVLPSPGHATSPL
ncbi:hypothetical protein ZIOFF_054729 [Zingiber officinale]|uniref:BZIP domain-containing protein n=1 Tax=Zingiber officinale TaxID=94328 RepID=A0A8J5FDZ8_ZINOF|nr:hypothetical protein ZIOFF_054729 [Zingiber officinale]